MAKRVSITRGFIEELKDLISCFRGVRYDSFVRYMEIALSVSSDAAYQIVEELLQRQHFVKIKYSGTTVIKLSKTDSVVYDYLDAFEAYLFILAEEKEKNAAADATVMSGGVVSDFVIATTSGLVYDLILSNDKGGQRLKILERADKKRYKNQITLFVFTSGTNLAEAKAPAIKGKHRMAVVRRSNTGRATCVAGEIEGKNAG